MSVFLRFPFGDFFSALFASLFAAFRSRAALPLEILALRHQLGVLQRSVKRPKLTPADRFLWAWLCEVWNDWRSSVFLVPPATVIGWHRKGFRLVLDGEDSTGPARAPRRAEGHSRADPNDQWREAFPWDTAPRYLLRDRDRIFGQAFVDQVTAMGMKQVRSALRSPGQRAYVKRVIGTLRRECLDHVIVFHQRSLSHHLTRFIQYYHHTRCPLSLKKDSPEPRPIQTPEQGRMISLPPVGGLHHRYERWAA